MTNPQVLPQPLQTQHRHSDSYPWLRLFLLACATVLIQGYHFGVDDAEIYIPAIKKFIHPHLYPFGAEFFLTHARFSIFAPVIGLSSRLLHLSVASTVFAWYLGSVLLTLVAIRQIALCLFPTPRAVWGSVLLVAALLPVPVAGTALVLCDNYFTPRSLSTPLALLSIGYFLRGRLQLAVLFLVVTALFHPQMAVYCAAFLFLLWAVGRFSAPALAWITLPVLPVHAPGSFTFAPASGVYRDILYRHTFFFASLWHWYEWIGVVAPLLLLALIARYPRRAAPSTLQVVARALVVLGLLSTAAFLLLSSSPSFDNFTRLQPMRSFQLLYLFLFVILGGLLGEYVLGKKLWRWLVLLLPLAAGMFLVDRSLYPASRHVEWPSRPSTNPWLNAFAWIRKNTPQDAVFAIDPNYMTLPREDKHGFRAFADRSVLSDFYKDSGAVTMFPALLEDWEKQQQVQQGWRTFSSADFQHLSRVSPVTWVVVRHPRQTGLDCPYVNLEVAVCRIGSAPAAGPAAPH